MMELDFLRGFKELKWTWGCFDAGKNAPYALLVFRGILLLISVAYSNSEVRGTLFYLGHSEKTFGTEVQFLCYGL